MNYWKKYQKHWNRNRNKARITKLWTRYIPINRPFRRVIW